MLELVAQKIVLRVPGEDGATIVLDGDALTLTADRTRIDSRETTVSAEMLELTARWLETTAELVRTSARLTEVDSEQIIERAGETFRTVRGLCHTRAGRMKQVAEHAFRIVGARTYVRAREDLKLRGERIELD